MSLQPKPRRVGAIRTILFAAAMSVPTGASAKTTGVSEDPSVQSGPCYDALVDKNAATPTTAPNRELGAACEAEHGDIDRAWERVVRLWGSDSVDLPDYDAYRPADAAPGAASPRWLAWVGLVLTYAVLGTPMRAAARLMGAVPSRGSGAVGDLVACLGLRALIGAMLVALLGLPYLGAVCGVALILWLMLGRVTGSPRRARPAADGGAGALATHLSSALNDGLGAAVGLAAVALFAQRSMTVLAIGLALALLASIAPLIIARRALRSTRLGRAAAEALLAAAIGEVVILIPPVAAYAGGSTSVELIVPLLLAGVTLAFGLRADLPPTRPAE